MEKIEGGHALEEVSKLGFCLSEVREPQSWLQCKALYLGPA
jgi:hypothetical protein